MRDKFNNLKETLASVLPGYKPISQAPTSIPDEVINESTWIHAESEKRYKAIDNAGNVYLIQNPLVAHYKHRKAVEEKRCSPLAIPVEYLPPTLEMTEDFADLTAKASGGRNKEQSVKTWGGGF